MTQASPITTVSDTALMVAACRAAETEAVDPFIHDPFAARLAGERGLAMLRSLPQPQKMQFGISVRTRFVDELLLEVLTLRGVRTVLSLGCGVDTRPWRLDLPAGVRWIEVDFEDMLLYKESLLTEAPKCRRERMAADINDAAQRRSVLIQVGGDPALMITEGLLMYLPAESVAALATDTRQSAVTHWITDISTTGFTNAIGMPTPASVRNVQAAGSLPGEQIFETIRSKSWLIAGSRSYLTDMAFATERGMALFGKGRPQPATPPPIPPNDPSGVQLFARE